MASTHEWEVSADGKTATETGEAVNEQEYNNGALAQGAASAAIEAGEQAKSVEYFSQLYVGFWDCSEWQMRMDKRTFHPHPVINEYEVDENFNWWSTGFSLRLKGCRTDSSATEMSAFPSCQRSLLPKIDGLTKYQFSFLADSIPDPHAIFYIDGGKYVCEKITATFHEWGKSQLMKGSFFKVVE